MANMSLEKIKMPEQAPDVRNKNFKEVSLGYTEEMAIKEAQRCLNCKHKPCVSGCPVNVRIPEFIAEVAKGDFMAAYKVITSTNALPAVCGRVCPQESQCESKCVRGIKGEAVAIGRLERFVADWYMKNCDEMPEKPASNGKKVAVIGSGPSALACAGDLAKQGYEVTMFEAFHKAGGVLVYGIPEFRLPKAIVQKEIDKLTALGVKIMTNMVIGKVLSIDEIIDDMGFDAVFIGTGAGLPSFMGIPGEALVGVYSANEFLTRSNLMKAYGAELVLTDGAKGMKGAIAKANELAEEIPNSFIAGQFTNPVNPATHRATTGPEIWNDTEGKVDIFIAGVGTGGTLSGVGEYLKSKNPDVKIVG